MIKKLEETILEILDERPGISKELLFNLVISSVAMSEGIVKLSDYKIAIENLNDVLEEKKIYSPDSFFNDYNLNGVYLRAKN